MKYMEKRDRAQKSFLPECVEDYIDEENPVRVIDAFVDSLEMEVLGFRKAKPAQTGRPAYDPRNLLKLYLYGYLNRIRSSRMLMRESRRNIELIYLLGGLKPDFRTIADFRKDNARAIRGTFLAFGEVCRECKCKCTGAEYKEVSFGPNTDCVPVRMFGTLTKEVQKIPPDARISPSNHTLDTGHVPKKKVVLRIRDDKEKLKQRMCLSEHPFGTVKWYNGARYLLCKGKTKAAGELGLSFLAYNLTRAINMVGAKALIAAM